MYSFQEYGLRVGNGFYFGLYGHGVCLLLTRATCSLLIDFIICARFGTEVFFAGPYGTRDGFFLVTLFGNFDDR